jgi:hypothetical protein
VSRIVPGLGDARRLVTSPRSQAKGDPIPTIVMLVGAIAAIQALKAVRAGQPVAFDQHMLIVDGGLIVGFVLAATVIPSDLIVAILLVALIYDIVIDPGLIADLTANTIGKLNLGGPVK